MNRLEVHNLCLVDLRANWMGHAVGLGVLVEIIEQGNLSPHDVVFTIQFRHVPWIEANTGRL